MGCVVDAARQIRYTQRDEHRILTLLIQRHHCHTHTQLARQVQGRRNGQNRARQNQKDPQKQEGEDERTHPHCKLHQSGQTRLEVRQIGILLILSIQWVHEPLKIQISLPHCALHRARDLRRGRNLVLQCLELLQMRTKKTNILQIPVIPLQRSWRQHTPSENCDRAVKTRSQRYLVPGES